VPAKLVLSKVEGAGIVHRKFGGLPNGRRNPNPRQPYRVALCSIRATLVRRLIRRSASEVGSLVEGGRRNYRASGVEYRESSIENPVSRIQYQESRIEHRVSSIKNRASSIQNRATIYSKQSQFAGHSNEHNLLINKGL